MSKKGIRRQAQRVLQQKINQQENKLHYQSGGEWKGPSTDRERIDRRTIK